MNFHSRRNQIDELGRRYGRWVVIRRENNTRYRASRWLCKCDCGKTGIVLGKNLRGKKSLSCGCLRNELTSKNCTINLVGRTFGRLTVKKRANGEKDRKNVYWECQCTCGKVKVVRGRYLQAGTIKSCGCLREEILRLPFGVAAFHRVVYAYRQESKKHGRLWDLTLEQAQKLFQEKCYYCQAEPRQKSQFARSHGAYFYNGLDRKDNTKGYTLSNVVPCCGKCNRAKNTASFEEFKCWITKVYETLNKIK